MSLIQKHYINNDENLITTINFGGHDIVLSINYFLNGDSFRFLKVPNGHVNDWEVTDIPLIVKKVGNKFNVHRAGQILPKTLTLSQLTNLIYDVYKDSYTDDVYDYSRVVFSNSVNVAGREKVKIMLEHAGMILHVGTTIDLNTVERHKDMAFRRVGNIMFVSPPAFSNPLITTDMIVKQLLTADRTTDTADSICKYIKKVEEKEAED